ncbi:hypothetical protein BC834DRAFT_820466 [Gloeopeniophorella convolvens]|nr:hypothetical protein BC834DRAFT_820466 [Gloeopeniophorella convolvens]
MPRIRKKTSKRGTTNRRSRIKQKVVESRKKAKKAAKKDVTWKSKKAKDPGIPNNFPYKDQILAEIAEERRQAAEAKAQRKEEKKALRAQQKAAINGDGEEGSGEEDDASGDEQAGFSGVTALGGRAEGSSKGSGRPAKSAPVAAAASSAPEAESVPLLLNPDLPHLAAVLDKADVVVEVLDARDPLAGRSKALEARVKAKEGQKLLLVLNKIDTCAREPTAAWAAHLRSEHPTLLFRAASAFLPPVVTLDPAKKGKGKDKAPADDAWGLEAVSSLLRQWAQEKQGDTPLQVAVVGLTNSGKSAFINSLARAAKLDVYVPVSSSTAPSTTPHALEVPLTLADARPIVLIDTPGFAWVPTDADADATSAEQLRAHDVLARNRGHIDRLKGPLPAAAHIVARAEVEDLMVFYSLPAFAAGDADAFLSSIARAHALIKKAGDPDLTGAARIVLRDWATGKLPRYAVPPPAPASGAAHEGEGEGDVALLSRLPTRKEMRRARGVVRLAAGQVDERAVALETPWFGADEDSEDSGSEGRDEEDEDVETDEDKDEDGEEDASDEDDEGSVDAEDDEDKNEEVPTPPPARKRKQPPPLKPTEAPARPAKKVAFATTLETTTRNAGKRQQRQQQKPASAPVLASALKKKAAPPQKAPAPRSSKPAANAPAPGKKKAAVAVAGGDDDAYDFGKYF